ncbi:MAG: YCF48-related protein [Pseudomonadota bacterium]
MVFLPEKGHGMGGVEYAGRSFHKGILIKIPALLILLSNLLFSPPAFSSDLASSESVSAKLHEDLFSVIFPTEKEGWACGRWGTILYTEDGGKTWCQQASGTDYTLSSIYFADHHHGWAVGDGGTVVSTDDGGKTWTKQKTSVKYFLMCVYFTDKDTGWIVTEKTHILHTKDGGENWALQFKDDDYLLKSVSFCDEKNGWAAGEYGIVYHTEDGGETWVKQAGGLAFSEETGEILAGSIIFGVFALNPTSAWVVGIDGYAAKTDDAGKNWERISEGIPKRHLFCVSGDKSGNLFIGGKGVFLVSFDNGQSWQSSKFDPSIIYSWIYNVTHQKKEEYVAVGKGGAIYASSGTNSQMVWHKVN